MLRTGESENTGDTPNQWVPEKILLNANNFTDEGGVYLATVERNSDELEIPITNTGIGIAMTSEKVIAIFELLEQADNSLSKSTKARGSAYLSLRR